MPRNYGGQNMVGRLRRVMVRRPDRFFGEADPHRWHYAAEPDLARAQEEHRLFVQRLEEHGVEVLYHESNLDDMADAIFVHDPFLMTDAGAILLQMGKRLRRAEPAAAERVLGDRGIPVFGRIVGDGLAEGGDLLWLDEQTLAVGQGPRTNHAGLEQLATLLTPLGVRMLPVALPEPEDAGGCLHLMSLISLVDRDLAVVYSPLLPQSLGEELARRGYRFVEVPETEFLTMGTNVLALEPGSVLMLEGNPRTYAALETAGCRVRTYRGQEISLKAEGGATCLTRPILRDR